MLFLRKERVMRYLFVILLSLPVCLHAQECKLKKDKEAYTGKPSLSTGFFTLASFSLSIDVTQKEIDYFLVLKTGANKCFDDLTTVTFIMEGGKQKFLLRNKGALNCDGILHLTMTNNANTPSALQKLAGKKIITIRLTYSDTKTLDISLDPGAQQMLLDKSACIAREAKTVL
jgi:hypothetical protein